MKAAQIHGNPPDEPCSVDWRRMRRRMLITGTVLLAAPSMAGAWKFRYHFLQRNFREITPGRVYAGGYQHSIPMTRILERYQIKTVLSLRSYKASGEPVDKYCGWSEEKALLELFR